MSLAESTPTLRWNSGWVPGFDFDKTFYLSGPMTGYSDLNYPAFESAQSALIASGVKVESPHKNEWPEGGENMPEAVLWLHMMKKAITQMGLCQGIILLKGWVHSRGVRRELQYALDHDWPVYYYHNYTLMSMNREGVQ